MLWALDNNFAERVGGVKSVPKQERGRASHPTALYTDFLIPQVPRTIGGELPQRRSAAREWLKPCPDGFATRTANPLRGICVREGALFSEASHHKVRASSLPGEANQRTKPGGICSSLDHWRNQVRACIAFALFQPAQTFRSSVLAVRRECNKVVRR